MNKFCFVAVSILLSACSGGGSGGGSSQSARERIESDPDTSMVDRVVFEQEQQAGIYQASNFAIIDIPAFGDPDRGTNLKCQELVVTDEDLLRSSDFTVGSEGEICAAAGGQSICFGQRSSGLRTSGRSDLILESLRVTSDEYSSVAAVEVGYNLPGQTTIETLVLSAFSPDNGCSEDQIENDFAADDIAGNWKVRVFRADEALPFRLTTGEMTCTASSCTGTVNFGPITTDESEKGLVLTAPATYLGAQYADSNLVISTARTTFALLLCPANTSVRNTMDDCRLVLGER